MFNFRAGDVVKVHFKGKDTLRAKTQIFSGVVIAIRGQGMGKTFKVLKDATGGVKVERTFPVASPLLEKIEVVKRPKKVKRAKLYYLRGKRK